MKKVILWYCGKCDRFVEAGGNFIDTADCYSRGAAEEVSSSSSSQWCWQILLPKKFKSSPPHHMEAEGLSSNLFSSLNKSHKHWKGVPPYSSPTKLDFDYDWVKENTSTWHFGLDWLLPFVNIWLTTSMYQLVGCWLKKRERSNIVLATKLGIYNRPGDLNSPGLSRWQRRLKNLSFNSLKLKSTSS